MSNLFCRLGRHRWHSAYRDGDETFADAYRSIAGTDERCARCGDWNTPAPFLGPALERSIRGAPVENVRPD